MNRKNLLQAALVLLLPMASLMAQQQDAGFCARVKMQIAQELTLERIGFEATLEVTNNDLVDPITNFSAQLTFLHYDKNLKDYVDATGRFFVQPPVLTSITGIEGNGVIGPGKTAVVRWFIIPTISAGGEQPSGQMYFIGADLAANFRGEPIPEETMMVHDDQILVKPEPQLEITYFQPRDVQGDEPFTPEVESPIPFTLGVLVKNNGYGPANNVVIDSKQPTITDNKNGLLLVAQLLNSEVMDVANAEPNLKVNLGDIPPGGIMKGSWNMITSVSGEFIEFDANYTHASELGGEATSVITSMEAHFIAAEVMDDSEGRDNVLDFLADTDRDEDQAPDTLYGSEGRVTLVTWLESPTLLQPLQNNTAVLSVNTNISGWGYIRTEDPAQNLRPIVSVVRNDGKVLNSNNSWTNLRYEHMTNRKLNRLNIFDQVTPGTWTYTVTYGANDSDVSAPVTRLHFVGEVSQIGGTYHITRDTQLYFVSDDESPVSINYAVNGGEWLPAYPFFITDEGTHSLTWYAVDANGNQESTKTSIISLSSAEPELASVALSEASLVPTGETLTVRPEGSTLSFSLPSGALNVDVNLDIFQGVVAHPMLSGVPLSPTPRNTANVFVSGEHADFYKYRLNGGFWSEEAAVTEAIALTGLSGEVTLEVKTRSQHWNYGANILAVNWTVDGTAVDNQITAGPALPMRQLGDFQVTGPTDYRWTLNEGYYRADAPVSSLLPMDRLDIGTHRLGIIGKYAGTWQDETKPSEITLKYDPMYGSDMSELKPVLSQTYPSAQGSSVNFDWDGTDSNNVVVAPGFYTIRLTLTDALGRQTFQTHLVEVEALTVNEQDMVASTNLTGNPHARGDLLVWQEAVNGINNIRARSLNDSTVTEVTNSSLNQEKPATDGRYVVWQGRDFGGNHDIYVSDMKAPAVEQITQTHDRDEINAVIDWPWVVYQAKNTTDPTAVWQLEARNLETSEVIAVEPTTADQFFPSVHAGSVVWDDRRNPGTGDIWYYNLETQERQQITANPFGQNYPVILGNTIVWQDGRNTQLDIWGYDLIRDQEMQLTNTAYNEMKPVLEGSWLLYQEDSVGPETVNFRITDLVTQRGAPLTRSVESKSNGSIVGNVLVWERADGRIRVADLPALQPVNTTSSPVAVTRAMVDRFGTGFALLENWNQAVGITELTRYASVVPEVVTQTATWNTAATGDDFPLQEGDFIWVRFPEERLLDLGYEANPTLSLNPGYNLVSFPDFPVRYDLYTLVEQLGVSNIKAVRLLDNATGTWHSLEVVDGQTIGPNHNIPRVAVLLLEMNQTVTDWRPM